MHSSEYGTVHFVHFCTFWLQFRKRYDIIIAGVTVWKASAETTP